MIGISQIATAHYMLAEFAAEVNGDLVVISERYRNKEMASWHIDLAGTTVTWVRDDVRLRVLAEGRGNEFIWIQCLGATFFSVYLTTNETIPDFRRGLDAREHAFRTRREEFWQALWF